ncbi:tonB-system energizer ExbB, partial [Caulobacter sp. 17J65-9]|nr:tonB-system energizer ExbB [Caulobacter sp. 17J65-9]
MVVTLLAFALFLADPAASDAPVATRAPDAAAATPAAPVYTRRSFDAAATSDAPVST